MMVVRSSSLTKADSDPVSRQWGQRIPSIGKNIISLKWMCMCNGCNGTKYNCKTTVEMAFGLSNTYTCIL